MDRGDPNIHNRVTRAQPNDRYQGPILAGQRWKSRGTSNHQYLLYTVLRFNGRSVKAVVEGSRHHGGKVYNVPEASWRGNFNLVKQAPGYDPDAPLTMEIPLTPADTLDEAIDLEASMRDVRGWHDAQERGDRTAPLWPADPQRPPDRLHARTEVILAHPHARAPWSCSRWSNRTSERNARRCSPRTRPPSPLNPLSPSNPNQIPRSPSTSRARRTR